MEFSLAAVSVLLTLLLGLFAALSRAIKVVRKAVARAREVRPQTRYFMA